MSSTITQASHQWASRPADQRFTSLDDLVAHFNKVRSESVQKVVPNRHIGFEPDHDNRGLKLLMKDEVLPHAPTHFAFGQLASLAEAPGGYLRTLPSPLVADCLNYGIRFKRDVEEIGLLLQSNGDDIVRAATGPRYGRVWNDDICRTLRNQFGNGLDGDWRIPGEFGKAVKVTKENTTLYASDRDMFVFLADETNRITVPNRRHGESGSLARGFFVWNSEVGDKTLGLASFLFDYVCCNRIVWGAESFKKLTIRHDAGAPERWLEEVQPVLLAYSHGSATPYEDAIKAAAEKKIADVDEFLAARFNRRLVQPMKAVFELEEHRPIETLWDATTAATAYAKGLAHQDARVDLERRAGDLLDLAV